jgi:hypothetical protein
MFFRCTEGYLGFIEFLIHVPVLILAVCGFLFLQRNHFSENGSGKQMLFASLIIPSPPLKILNPSFVDDSHLLLPRSYTISDIPLTSPGSTNSFIRGIYPNPLFKDHYPAY